MRRLAEGPPTTPTGVEIVLPDGSSTPLPPDDLSYRALVRTAIARNPHHMPHAHFTLWADHLRRGEVDQAYQEALRYRDTGFFWRNLTRASCLGHLGRFEEARVEIAELLRTKPDFARRGRTLIGRLLKLPDLQARVADGLAKAGLVLDAREHPGGST